MIDFQKRVPCARRKVPEWFSVQDLLVLDRAGRQATGTARRSTSPGVGWGATPNFAGGVQPYVPPGRRRVAEAGPGRESRVLGMLIPLKLLAFSDLHRDRERAER